MSLLFAYADRFSHDVAHMELDKALDKRPYLWPYFVVSHVCFKDIKLNDAEVYFLMTQFKWS